MIKKYLKILINLIQSSLSNNVSKAIDKLNNLEGINYLDIGAAGEINSRWDSIKKHVNYFGFEPDARSYYELLKARDNYKSYFINQKGVWDCNTKIKFYLCKKPEVSSALLPNLELLKRFPDSSRFSIESEIELDVDSLDNSHKEEVDFIKIDVQGGELNILKGAEKTITSTLGLELEIEFIQLYKNQPLFGEIKEWLKLNDFEFIDFLSLYRWGRGRLNGYGQCVFSDALFLKLPEKIQFGSLSRKKISAYLSILLIYRRFDLIEKSIDILKNNNTNVYTKFLEEVNKIKKLDNYVHTINKYHSRLISILGHNYRSHVLY